MDIKHTDTGRARLLRRAVRLEGLTVGWNVVEGIIAVAAGLAAGSVALLGFGIDSFVETISGAVILWRIGVERRASDEDRIRQVEDLARRGVAVSLWLLSAYVIIESINTLASADPPSSSPVGVVLLIASVAVMKWLANAKRSVARKLHSHAMEADAAQTNFCWRLSVVALLGIAANAVLGWWWADPVAALALAALISVEAWRTWKTGTDCC